MRAWSKMSKFQLFNLSRWMSSEKFDKKCTKEISIGQADLYYRRSTVPEVIAKLTSHTLCIFSLDSLIDVYQAVECFAKE